MKIDKLHISSTMSPAIAIYKLRKLENKNRSQYKLFMYEYKTILSCSDSFMWFYNQKSFIGDQNAGRGNKILEAMRSSKRCEDDFT